MPGAPGGLSWLNIWFDFSLGEDIMIREFEPHIGLHPDNAERAWDFSSLPLSSRPQLKLTHSLSLSK